MKRSFVALLLLTMTFASGCQLPYNGFTLSSGNQSMDTVNPTPPSLHRSDTATVGSPQSTTSPEPGIGYIGEWAGYLGGGEGSFALDRKYAAKLTISENSAWMALDGIFTEDTYNTPYIPKIKENSGIRMDIESFDESGITLSINEYAYHIGDVSPLLPGNKLRVTFYPIHDMQDADAVPGVFGITPAYTGVPNDLLIGSINGSDGMELYAAFARLTPQNNDTLTGNPRWPAWQGEYEELSPGVRGVYSFGETGADNDNSTYVFVYNDNMGLEHIRFTFAWAKEEVKREGQGAVVFTEPMFEYNLSMTSIPYWDTIYALDCKTGEFIDVSQQYPEYYQKESIPRYTLALVGAMKEKHEANDKGYFEQQYLDAYTDALLRAYFITDGKLRKNLPELPAFDPNMPGITAEFVEQGAETRIDVCFFNYADFASPDYDSAALYIDGVWNGYLRFGDEVIPQCNILDIDIAKPGVVLAFQLFTSEGEPYVLVYDFWGGGMVYVCNDPIWGTLPPNEGDLGVRIPGDGTVHGVRRISSDNKTFEIIAYDFNERFITMLSK